MKREEAAELVRMIAAATSNAELSADKRAVWEEQLVALDADQATQAALAGIRTWKFFPSWSEFAEVYTSIGRLAEPDDTSSKLERYRGTRPQTLAPWVRRWAAARFLFARFGRERDDRPFREQQPLVDPHAELMPDDEWVTEGEQLSDRDVWRAVVGGRR